MEVLNTYHCQCNVQKLLLNVIVDEQFLDDVNNLEAEYVDSKIMGDFLLLCLLPFSRSFHFLKIITNAYLYCQHLGMRRINSKDITPL